MSISIKKARDFVYENGVLWERAAFAYLFDGGPLERVHQCLLCYKNPDGGWAHGLEHDIKTPESHPAALEYILGALVRDLDLPAGDLFSGSAAWVEAVRRDDGSLGNPPALLDYPLAPWWREWGGQSAPDSITGHLTRLGLVTPGLAQSTRAWAQTNLTLDKIQANEWLFMAYHAYDYFMNVNDFPGVEQYRQATINNIATCAAAMPETQFYSLMQFAGSPQSAVAQAIPQIVSRALDYLTSTQRDDGGWDDQHNMKHWQPSVTLIVLRALLRHGLLAGAG